MNTEFPEGNHEITWSYPKVGTCGQPVDKLTITVYRTASVPDLVIGFDLERNGWVIGENYLEGNSDQYSVRELRFIPSEEFQSEQPDQ